MFTSLPSVVDLPSSAAVPGSWSGEGGGAGVAGPEGGAFDAALETAGSAGDAPDGDGRDRSAEPGATPAVPVAATPVPTPAPVTLPSSWLTPLATPAAKAAEPVAPAAPEDARDASDETIIDPTAVMAAAVMPATPAPVAIALPVAPSTPDVPETPAATPPVSDTPAGEVTAGLQAPAAAAPPAPAAPATPSASAADGASTFDALVTDDTPGAAGAAATPDNSRDDHAAEGRPSEREAHAPDVTATYAKPKAQSPATRSATAPAATGDAAATATNAAAASQRARVIYAPVDVLAAKTAANAAPRAAAVPVVAPVLQHATMSMATMVDGTNDLRLDAATGAAIGAEIVQSIRVQTAALGGEATIRLNPNVLGRVDIAVKVEQGAVTATVQASTPAVREWVAANRDELSQTLAQQGLRLERLDITAPKDDATRDAHRDGRAPERETPRPPRREPREDQDSFDVPFAEARDTAGAA